MTIKHQLNKFIAITSVAALTACGGGGGSTPTPTPTPSVQTGTFIDSAVEGLAYRTETLSGVTNQLGEFNYQLGETVIFSIGEIELPPIVIDQADKVITPLSVYDTEDVTHTGVVNTVQLLQTLDDDNNPDNGITISDSILEQIILTDVNLSSDSFDSDVQALLTAANLNVELVTEDDAISHFKETLENEDIVTAPVLLTGLSLEDDFTILLGNSKTISVNLAPTFADDQVLVWQSNNEQVATVDNNGVITPVNGGSVVISATNVASELTDSLTVTVEIPFVDITDISLGENQTIIVGNTQQLSAVISPDNATESSLVWSSSDENIATVDNNGLVTTVSLGTVTISATNATSNVTGTVDITVSPVLITEITLGQNFALDVDGTQQLSANISPENAADKTIVWSSNSLNASVSSTGLVTALTPGSATISATNEVSGIVGTVDVLVNDILATSLVLSGDFSLDPENTETITSTILPAETTNKALTWSTSNASVATVTNGLVTAVAPGSAVITATNTDSGLSDTVNVTVNEVLATAIELGDEVTLDVSDTTQLNPVFTPTNTTNTSVTWMSSNTDSVTVSESGLVTAIAPGSATITVTNALSGLTDTVVINVNDIMATSIAIGDDITLALNDTEQLSAMFTPGNTTDQTITWASSDTGIVTISVDGIVTAVGNGIATITATNDASNQTDTISVISGDILATGVDIGNNLSINVSSTSQLQATFTPAEATDKSVTWVSSNPSIATITDTGLVTGITPGSATITVTNSASGQTDTLQVTIVGELPEGTIQVDLQSHQYLGETGSLQRNKFFNIHGSFTQSGFTPEVLQGLYDDYDMDHGRQFWGPFSQSVVTTSLADNGTYPPTSTAMSLGTNSVNNYNASDKQGMYSNRAIATEKPATVLKTNNDPIAGAKWAADYFTHYFNDENRPVFYEPMNEPLVHTGDFIAQHGPGHDDVREYMSQWFAELGKEIDSRPELSEMKVIGFADAYPAMEVRNFDNWRDRWKTFLDIAGEHVDAFSVHLYNGVNVGSDDVYRRSGSNMQAIFDMIETYSINNFGEVKPHAVTEYGTIVRRGEGEIEYVDYVNSQTIKGCNQILMELLMREDRILTSIPFITEFAPWYWENPANEGNPYNPSMWRPNKNNIHIVGDKYQFIDANAADNYLLNENAKFFEFWKDVKGRRVETNVGDPDLQVVAYVNDDTAYIVISNLEEANKDVQLNLEQMTGFTFSEVELERLNVPATSAPTLTSAILTASGDVDGQNKDFGNLTLASEEIVKFTITLNKEIDIEQTKQNISYYSPTQLTSIVANTAIVHSFTDVDVATDNAVEATAMLRLGLGREHDRSKAPTITVNGTPVTVPDDWAGWDQAAEDSFFGVIDVPVPFDAIAATTNVSVTFSDTGGHLSTLVLEVNKPIPGVVPTSIAIGEQSTDIELTETIQLSAEVLPLNAPDLSVTWSSSNENVATVNENGLVTAIADGDTTISATASNNIVDSITITVNPQNANLLHLNGSDFEDGADTDWGKFWETPADQFSITADAAANDSHGSIHLNCLADGKRCGLSLSSSKFPQTFGENLGRRFLLSMDIKINNFVSDEFVFRYDILPDGGWNPGVHSTLSAVTSGDWTTVTAEFNEFDGSGQNPYRIEGYFTRSGGALNNEVIDAYIDNISIVEIIE